MSVSWRVAHKTLLVAGYVFLLAPILMVLLASVDSANYFSFPPSGVSLRWYRSFVDHPALLHALFFSLKLGVVAAAVSTCLGAAAALAVVRTPRVAGLLRPVMLAPLLVPGILTGVALLIFVHVVGLASHSFIDLVAGHAVQCLPFVFLIVGTAVARLDRRLQEAARSLGAHPMRVLFRITLPLIKGGIASAFIIAFIVSFDEFNVSLMIAPTQSPPLPIAVFQYLQFTFDSTIAAVGVISVAIAVIGVALVQWLVGLDSIYLTQSES